MSMAFDAPPNEAEINACVAALRTATASLERLSPAALSALARAAGCFVREAKRLRRRRVLTRPGAPARARTASGSPRVATTPRVATAPRVASRSSAVRREAAGPPGRCYACRSRHTGAHPRYPALCPACGAINLDKRDQSADLSGRVGLVTGARTGAGYTTALKLLRAGAVVIGTSRFPRDAAERFAAEPDARRWSARLHLYGLDFRAPGWVEGFAAHVAATVGRLDILVNNAAQTVRRPAPFFAHLIDGERATDRELTTPVRRVLAAGREFAGRHAGAPIDGEAVARSAMLSQIHVLPEDAVSAIVAGGAGVVAVDGGCDLRTSNSWMARLDEVATAECLEVLLVNTAAPFVLAGKLRAAMARDALADKWIVNVAAVEGQFSRRQKDDRHPHLNMAKAALNMLTRSCAADYARDRIFMNSVDVGWFSNGEPAAVADAMRSRGFTLPLDAVDAAARICDPIFSGVRTGRSAHGQLLKDYRPVEW